MKNRLTFRNWQKTDFLIVAIITVLMCSVMLPVHVLAQGSIDLNRETYLKISYQAGDTPLVGAEFAIYQVASVDECGQLTKTEAF